MKGVIPDLQAVKYSVGGAEQEVKSPEFWKIKQNNEWVFFCFLPYIFVELMKWLAAKIHPF